MARDPGTGRVPGQLILVAALSPVLLPHRAGLRAGCSVVVARCHSGGAPHRVRVLLCRENCIRKTVQPAKAAYHHCQSLFQPIGAQYVQTLRRLSLDDLKSRYRIVASVAQVLFVVLELCVRYAPRSCALNARLAHLRLLNRIRRSLYDRPGGDCRWSLRLSRVVNL